MKTFILIAACALFTISANTAQAVDSTYVQKVCNSLKENTGAMPSAIIVVSSGKDIVFSCKTGKSEAKAPVSTISVITTTNGCVVYVDDKGRVYEVCS